MKITIKVSRAEISDKNKKLRIKIPFDTLPKERSSDALSELIKVLKQQQ